MSSISPADPHRRRLLLRLLVKIMLWISLLIGAWVIFTPLLKSTAPVNSKAIETTFDVNDMRPGEVDLVEWFGKPLIIAYRDASQEQALLAAVPATLEDPDSENSSQPAAFENELRSITAGWFVSLGLGTGSGCALKYDPALIPSETGFSGGFVDRCDASRYDLAGRVLVKQSSRKNTNIPVWRFESGKIIVSTEKP